MLYNINRDSKKDPDGKSWTDFFPEHQEQPEPQTDEEMLMAMRLWSMATAHLSKPS